MKIQRLVWAILITLLVCACSPKEYQTRFYVDRSILEENRSAKDSGLMTTQAVIRIPEFWTKFVLPKLGGALRPSDVSMRNSARLELGAGRDGKFSEAILVLRSDSQTDAKRVADAIIVGLAEYLADLDGGKNAPYVRH